jgi:hypothetical protein
MGGGGKRASHVNSCVAKLVSFISLATFILFLHYLDETRKFLFFGSEEIPAGNMNEEIQMAECIAKSQARRQREDRARKWTRIMIMQQKRGHG